MSIHTYKNGMSLLKSLGVSEINLTGGEPLIVKNINEYISIANDFGLNVGLSTNAKGLSKQRIDELVAFGVTRFAFSIDSLDERETEKVRSGSNVKNILNVIAHVKTLKNISLSITAVITAVNYKSLYKLMLFSARNNITLNIQPVFLGDASNESPLLNFDYCSSEWGRFVRTMEIWGNHYKVSEYQKIVVKYLQTGVVDYQKCGLKGKVLVIYPSGDVFPCFFANEFFMGNVNTDKQSILCENLLGFSHSGNSCYRSACIVSGYNWEAYL